MSKYYLYLEQAGEGCDYMIGCGNKLVALMGQTYDDATAEACALFVGDDAPYALDRDDQVIAKAVVFEYCCALDLDQLKEQIAAAKKAAAEKSTAARQEQHERAELARLQAKYGGTGG